MIKIIKKILLGLGILIVILVGVAYLLPSKIHVVRSITINSTADKIYLILSDFKSWDKFLPWTEMDPEMKSTYSENTSSIGSWRSWTGPKSGAGKMSFVELKPNLKVKYTLKFEGDDEETIGEFDLKGNGNQTDVTWSFSFDLGLNPVKRYFGLMLDKWIGDDFNKGLNKLKSVTTQQATN